MQYFIKTINANNCYVFSFVLYSNTKQVCLLYFVAVLKNTTFKTHSISLFKTSCKNVIIYKICIKILNKPENMCLNILLF